MKGTLTVIGKTDYLEQQFQPSLQALVAQRAEILAVLTPLSPEDWSRTATGAGRPRGRTVPIYAQWLANHERSHFKQMACIVNALRM